MDEKALLALFANDKSKALEQVLKTYTGFVFAIVRGRLGEICTSSEIEDCVNDVFIRFAENLEKFNPDRASLKTYLGVIARNCAANIARNRLPTVSIDDDLIEIPDDYDLEDEIAKKELAKTVIEQIKLLGSPDSEILFRKYYLGESTKQIAAELKLSPSNVDVRAHRAMEKLRKKLGGML